MTAESLLASWNDTATRRAIVAFSIKDDWAAVFAGP
jgi:hypothetical protein